MPRGLVSLRALAGLPALRRCFLGAGSIEGSDGTVLRLPAGSCARTLQYLAASARELLVLFELLQAASCLDHVAVLGIPGVQDVLSTPFLWVWARQHPPLKTLEIQLDGSSGNPQMSLPAVQHMMLLKNARPALHIDVGCEIASDCAHARFAHPVGHFS